MRSDKEVIKKCEFIFFFMMGFALAFLFCGVRVFALDWGGADLIPDDYDVLSGTYTNVGMGGFGGEPGFSGADGFGPGKGIKGLSVDTTGYGGGGGGYGGAGGPGDILGSGGGAGGSVYNSTSALSISFSADDIFMGSGGGGGGGGKAGTTSGSGGSGGGLVYLEGDYIVISGTISANGLEGGAGINSEDDVSYPGGGGGGSGGGILLKSRGPLILNNSSLRAEGGRGGDAICSGLCFPNPGGGGGGGRIKLVYKTISQNSVFISTSWGRGGEMSFSGTYASSGTLGTVSFGVLPSSPTNFQFASVFITSVSYSWNSMPLSEWGGVVSQLPDLTTYQFRLYKATNNRPFSDYYLGLSVSSDAFSMQETGLVPNTQIQRFITSYTDYSDSLPSNFITTYTYAAAPEMDMDSFISVSSYFVTIEWSSGTDGAYNPSYTEYEFSYSSSSSFDFSVSTQIVQSISSTTVSMIANTTYYFRVRAVGLNSAYTGFSQVISTPTLGAVPENPFFSSVFVDSAVVSWSAASNPDGTLYNAQISSDNFLSVSSAILTSQTTAYFGNLDPGSVYYARVCSVNHAQRWSDYSVVVTTKPGAFENLEAPGKPEPPRPTKDYSYDGSVTFTWYPPSGDVPISEIAYSTDTLQSGKTYYARVRAESTAGVLGEFSQSGPGVTVWIRQSESPISKPYSWPNPFNPRLQNANIGFYLKEPARVTLKIFTLQGFGVYEKTDYESFAGNKVWLWNGKNGEGRIVEPGGYIVYLIKHYLGGAEKQKFKMAVLY